MSGTRRRFVGGALAGGIALHCRTATGVSQNDVDYSEFAPPELQLTVQVLSLDGNPADGALIEQTVAVLTERAEWLEVAIVHTGRLDEARVVLSLRNVDDVDLIVALLTKRGFLEIIDPQGSFLDQGTIVATTMGGPPPDQPRDRPAATPQPVYQTILSNEDISDAFVTTDQLGTLVVGFRLTDDAAIRFEAFTAQNVGRPMSIVVDGVVVSSPVINAPISYEGIIQGMPAAEVQALVIQLATVPLPGRIELLELRRRD